MRDFIFWGHSWILTLLLIGIVVIAAGTQRGVGLYILVIESEEGGQAASLAMGVSLVAAGVAPATGARGGGGCRCGGGGGRIAHTSSHLPQLVLLDARLDGNLVGSGRDERLGVAIGELGEGHLGGGIAVSGRGGVYKGLG